MWTSYHVNTAPIERPREGNS